MRRISTFASTGFFAARRAAAFALTTLFAVVPMANASQVEVKIIDSYRALSGGTFEDMALTADGTLRLGRATTTIAKELTGPVLDLVEHKGDIYVAVASPPRVMRVRPGKPPETVAAVDAGLITALVSYRGELAAVTTPDGGVVLIDVKTKKVNATIPIGVAKVILGAAVLDDTLYVVGGGDEGVLARLDPKKKTFEVLVKTKEAHLRTILADSRTKSLLIGGGDDGILYRFDPKAKDKDPGQLHALFDAAPSETTCLATDSEGRVYATFVDASAKLSDGATARDKSEETEKPKPSKPRKIKSSEVVRIDPDGAVHVLWQSKVDGALSCAMATDGKRLLVGTGAGGKIFDIDPSGTVGPSVVARAKGFDEVTRMISTPTGFLAGTAHSGGVVRIENKMATKGAFMTAALGASTLAQWGRLSFDHDAPAATSVKVSMRTGNTKEPDQTWTAFSPPLIHAGQPAVARGKFMQVKVELMGDGTQTPAVRSIRAAYLEDNRPPEVDRLDLVLPNTKVTSTPADPKSGSRSVTFGTGAFKKFLYDGGSPLPKLTERTSGKQLQAPGWRTVFAWAEDPDKDLLRYRWSLGRVGPKGRVENFVVVKEWSDEPFLSFDSDRYDDGVYRARVEVSDLPSNGPDRAKSDTMTSSNIVASRAVPQISGARARVLKTNAVRVRFDAKAQVPLILAQCSVGGDEWIPIDSLDGLVDGDEERFETVLDGRAELGAVSCAVTDELGHTTTVALPLR